MKAPRYKAFISYSHRDEKWARWLQRSLETYRVPRRLVGSKGAYGPVPKRLTPIFRDREDLSSASDLSTRIREELCASETLIVVCSPAAVASGWVSEEIRYFKKLGRGGRILALVVDGDPHAGGGDNGCFPHALRESSDGGLQEPLAADVRKYADGKRLSRLKIVAGMLGLRLDELRRRDAHRRNRNLVIYSISALALISVVSWLSWSAISSREQVRAQHANTEQLLGYMLGELKSLDPIEGLEIVVEGDETQSRLSEQFGFENIETEQLVDKAMKWREEGINVQQRGDAQAAMTLFLRSRAAFIELYWREGGTSRALFELGQAAFYVGAVHFEQGELDAAEESWVRYGAITRRLLNAEPKNSKYVMELSYTLMNLGALEQSRPVPDAARSLELLQSAVKYNQMALVLDPGSSLYRNELGTNLAWLADAWLEKCDLGNAYRFRTQAVELRRELHEQFPDDRVQQRELAFSLSGLAEVQQQMGVNREAISSYEESVNLLRDLYLADPDDLGMEWEVIYRSGRMGRRLMWLGEIDAAWKLFQPLFERMEEITSSPLSIDHTTQVEAAELKLDIARLMLFRGEPEKANQQIQDVIQTYVELIRQKPGFRESLAGLARAYFAYWEDFGGETIAEVENTLSGYLGNSEDVQSCEDKGLAARLALIHGDRLLAARYAQELLDRGYFESEFVTLCRHNDLCD